MNKFSILLLSALAFGFTACDDSPAVPPVQSNPQPPMYESSQISCSKDATLASSNVIDLESYKAAELGVPVVAFSTTEEFPAGAYPSGVLEIAKSDSFDPVYEIPVTVTDGVGYADAYTWNDAIQTMFGRAHKEHEIHYRLIGYVNQDGGIYRIGTPTTYLVEGTAEVMGMEVGVAISDAYYLLGGCTSWSLDPAEVGAFKMYHTSSADAMDDPVFRFYINISDEQGECWWKIAPQEALTGDDSGWSLCLGPRENGNTNEQGSLVEGENTDNAAAKIEGTGTYCIEIDAIAMTYNVYKTDVEVPYLFTPGGANGWDMYASQWLPWVSGKGAYMAPIKVDAGDGVKFVDIVRPGYGGPSWDNPNYGGTDGTLELGGPNIKPENTAIYIVSANTETLTYTLTEVTSISLIGVGGDWDNDIDLTPSNDLLKWSARVDLSAGWKVRFNHSWDFNYGNTPSDLVVDGGNIEGYDGTYNVTFDMTGNLPRLVIAQ